MRTSRRARNDFARRGRVRRFSLFAGAAIGIVVIIVAFFWVAGTALVKVGGAIEEYADTVEATRAVYTSCMARMAKDTGIEQWRAEAICRGEQDGEVQSGPQGVETIR